jgi:transposase-like protein
MLNTRGLRFPIDVVLVCIRWYAAYPLSYRHLEEMQLRAARHVLGTGAWTFGNRGRLPHN